MWDTIDLVWHSIADGFSHVTNTWWENQEILDLTSDFVKVSTQHTSPQLLASLILHVANIPTSRETFGFRVPGWGTPQHYKTQDGGDHCCGYPWRRRVRGPLDTSVESFPKIFRRVIKELQSRFNHFVETGDDSKIPPDLQAVTYRIVVKHGGREQWEFVKGINEAGKTPTSRIAAM